MPFASTQAMLVYLELLLIAQYTFQIPTRLHCPIVTAALRDAAEFVGLHGSALRCLPIFALYLATLMHTYSLARWQRAHGQVRAPPNLELCLGGCALTQHNPSLPLCRDITAVSSSSCFAVVNGMICTVTKMEGRERGTMQSGHGVESGEGDIETGDAGPAVDSHGHDHSPRSSGSVHRLSEYVRHFTHLLLWFSAIAF